LNFEQTQLHLVTFMDSHKVEILFENMPLNNWIQSFLYSIIFLIQYWSELSKYLNLILFQNYVIIKIINNLLCNNYLWYFVWGSIDYLFCVILSFNWLDDYKILSLFYINWYWILSRGIFSMRVWIVFTYEGKRHESVGKLVNIKTLISSNSNSLTHRTLLILFTF
jgi:hypothetical protein